MSSFWTVSNEIASYGAYLFEIIPFDVETSDGACCECCFRHKSCVEYFRPARPSPAGTRKNHGSPAPFPLVLVLEYRPPGDHRIFSGAQTVSADRHKSVVNMAGRTIAILRIVSALITSFLLFATTVLALRFDEDRSTPHSDSHGLVDHQFASKVRHLAVKISQDKRDAARKAGSLEHVLRDTSIAQRVEDRRSRRVPVETKQGRVLEAKREDKIISPPNFQKVLIPHVVDGKGKTPPPPGPRSVAAAEENKHSFRVKVPVEASTSATGASDRVPPPPPKSKRGEQQRRENRDDPQIRRGSQSHHVQLHTTADPNGVQAAGPRGVQAPAVYADDLTTSEVFTPRPITPTCWLYKSTHTL